MPNLDIDRAVSLLSKLPIRDRFSRRIVPFQPNPGQRVMIEAIRRQQRQRRPIRIIALKARRVGVSALSEGLGVCHCLSDEGKLGLIVAHMFKTSKALFEVPTNLLTRHLKGQQSLCELLGLPRPTKHRAVFPHDAGESELNLATAGNVEGGRGQGFSYLHLSEAAFFPGVQSFVSLLPTVPHDPSTIIVIESTANGRVGPGEDFYDFWNSAVEGANDYAPIFIPWYTDPHCSRPADEADDAPANDYEKMLMSDFNVNKAQIAWYRATLETECKGYAPLMQQEYPTTPEEAFIATGDPAFDQAEIAHVRTLVDAAPQPKAVRFLVESLRRPESYQVEVLATTPNDIDRITDTYLLVWESPRPDCRYKLGADAARGEEDGDFAAICVWNEDTGEQAAQLDARIPPEELALWCNCIGRWYNNAMVNIELTGNLGVWAQKVLRDNFKYPLLYRWKGGRDDRIGDSNRMSTKRVIGWETTERSKQMAFDAFRAGVRQRRCFPRSVKLLQQMDSATRKEGFRWEVLRGHDDILMAALVGWIAVEQWGPPQRDMPSRGSQGPYGKGGNATEEPKVMGDVQAQAAAHFKRIMSAVRNRIGTDRLAGI